MWMFGCTRVDVWVWTCVNVWVYLCGGVHVCGHVGVHVWICVVVHVWAETGALDLPKAAAGAHTVFAKQVICFPGFVFLLPAGSGPSCKQRELKNAALPVFPMLSAPRQAGLCQLGCPALPQPQEATSHGYHRPCPWHAWAEGGGRARRGSRTAHCTSTPEPASPPRWY